MPRFEQSACCSGPFLFDVGQGHRNRDPPLLRIINIPVYRDSLFILVYIFKFQYRRRDSLSIATRCDASEISKGFVQCT